MHRLLVLSLCFTYIGLCKASFSINDFNKRQNSLSIHASRIEANEASYDLYELSVIVNGKEQQIIARSNESVLTALERSGLHIQPPNDCRRGNCLTCCGRILSGAKDSLKETPDTFLSHEAQQEGLFLSCSSSVVGNGLRIELGRNQDAWKIMFRDRFTNKKTEKIGQEASAKVMRSFAEKYPEKWLHDLEKTFDTNSNGSKGSQ